MKSITLKAGRNIITVSGPVRISTQNCRQGIRITGGAPDDVSFRDGTAGIIGELGPHLTHVFNFNEQTIAIVGREGDVVEYGDGQEARDTSRTW